MEGTFDGIKEWFKGIKSKNPKSWLGHIKGAGNIDYMLIEGASKEELEKYRKGINQHLHHLKKEHGLQIIQKSGEYIFKDSLKWIVLN